MLSHLLVAALAASSALAAPTVVEKRQASNKCANPRVRKAWHKLTRGEKSAYLDAELCLMDHPATLGLRGAKTKFDELTTVHILESEIAHFVGAFLPFHRLYIHAHDVTLRTLCNYTGPHPYWDETYDSASFTNSDLFSTTEPSFGGNGIGQNQCIETGPFASYRSVLGPGYRYSPNSPKCITRNINNFSAAGASQATVDGCLNQKDWLSFWACAEGRPHGAGHGGVGAEMGNPVSSPGDPTFYLHHAWLDRLWAQWQDLDPVVRLKEMGGNNKMRNGFGQGPPGGFPGGGDGTWPPPGFEFPPPGNGTGGGFPGGGFGGGPGFGTPEDLVRPEDVPEPVIEGDGGGNVTTLGHVLHMHGLIPDATIGDVMDTRGELLCFEYE
ncbi:putative tyrosinase [Triangularia verruculosa]|uniref:Tyrosinase n=1 Tax=Triangularia verruculosa TaxID=2587418 RepID=A0AAN6XE60_9PEZI|nr:putative tyrosinase [Triangularia verruculosa]